MALLLIVAVLAAASRYPMLTGIANATATVDAADRKINVDPDTVYVPGSGFSGFWYTLGQLSSSSSNSAASDDLCCRCQIYHCYSAGCMAVVVSLSGRVVQDVLNPENRARRGWMRGRIGGYNVVLTFVKNLLLLTTTTTNTKLVN